MGVSKTDFVRGLQCPKMLWLDSHRPELKIIPEEVQRRLDAGNEFGDRAMGIFGAYVETTLYRPDGRLDYAGMIRRTQECLAAGEPVICEAAFSWYGNFCAADILRRTGEGYDLCEVKNAPAPRQEFLLDLGFQSFLIGKCGVKLGRRYLILNGEEGENDENDGDRAEMNGQKYRIVDETAAAKRLERTADAKIWSFAKLKRKDAPMPEPGVGEQCDAPYRCWYYGYCHGTQENPEKFSSER